MPGLPESDGRIVDLHCHTSASGGAIGTPMRAAEHFREIGVVAYSHTEHDNFRSLPAAREAAAANGLEFVPGIEVTVRVDDPDLPDDICHYLLYDFDRLTPELLEIERGGLQRARATVAGTLDVLRDRGIADITEAELAAHVKVRFGADDVWKHPLSMGPLGDLLRQRGVLPEDRSRTVRDLVAEFGTDSLDPPVPTVGDVARWGREAGAVRILAHPFGPGTETTPAERRRLEIWLERYVDGIELFRYYRNSAYQAMIWELVSRDGRPFTGGSDTHAYPDPKKASEAPYACLESLRAWKAGH